MHLDPLSTIDRLTQHSIVKAPVPKSQSALSAYLKELLSGVPENRKDVLPIFVLAPL
jgi:hypothetical protein